MHLRFSFLWLIGRVLPLAAWGLVACKDPVRGPAVTVQITSTIPHLDKIDLTVRQSFKDDSVQRQNPTDGGRLTLPWSVTLTSDSPGSEPFYVAARGWVGDKVIVIRSATVTWPAAGQPSQVCLPLTAECVDLVSCEAADPLETCVAGACSSNSKPTQQCGAVEPASDAGLRLGDVNGDGVVDSLDLACLRQLLLGDAGTSVCRNADARAGDMNQDGQINEDDFAVLKALVSSR